MGILESPGEPRAQYHRGEGEGEGEEGNGCVEGENYSSFCPLLYQTSADSHLSDRHLPLAILKA